MGKPSRRKQSPLGPPVGKGWIWITTEVMGSITFQALSITARRILDFLLYEHHAHGGRENGRLGATYRQLETWGCTPDDVSKGFQELEMTGFVHCTHRGLRQAGGGDHSLYEITFIATIENGNVHPPKNAYADVIKQLKRDSMGSVRAARAWLRRETRSRSRLGKRRPRRLITPNIDGAPQVTSDAPPQVMVDGTRQAQDLGPQMKSENDAPEGLPSVFSSQPARVDRDDEPVLPSFLDRRTERGERP